jgi:hypothetical protein
VELERRVRVVHVATHFWLVLDQVLRPRFGIVYAPAVNRRTFETLFMYRVDKWALTRAERTSLGWFDSMVEASSYCTAEVSKPDLNAPIRDGYGSAVTPELQRERRERGLDPRTGQPR